jgi:PKD domain
MRKPTFPQQPRIRAALATVEILLRNDPGEKEVVMRRQLSFLARGGFTAVFLALLLGVLSAPSSATASPPANDNFADAQAITSFPFSDSGDLNGTTTEPGEPQPFASQVETVWYSFTTTSNAPLTIDVIGSDASVSANVYQYSGGGFGGLNLAGCVGNLDPFQFRPQLGSTYYIQVGSTDFASVSMQLHVAKAPGPANDDFANAANVANLPFSDHVDLTNASVEQGENRTPNGAFTPLNATVWYAITPSTTETLTASSFLYCCTAPIIAVYTGSSLANLSQVAGNSFQPVSFRANAGTTYYIQPGIGFVDAGIDVQMDFSLNVAPPPTAQFFYFPSDPSVYDTVQFYDVSYDPAGLGIASWAWDLGDGTIANTSYVTHRYASDGDYTVNETVTTTDGRSATATQTVHVRTHDVFLTTLQAPNSAKVGKTAQLVAKLGNTHYPETVEVDLLKSVPGGFTQVGSLTQNVPVMRPNQTIDFKINYTFTGDDAELGSVTFKAEARLLSGRDALPGNNEAIASPTRVTW